MKRGLAWTTWAVLEHALTAVVLVVGSVLMIPIMAISALAIHCRDRKDEAKKRFQARMLIS